MAKRDDEEQLSNAGHEKEENALEWQNMMTKGRYLVRGRKKTQGKQEHAKNGGAGHNQAA